MRVLTLMLSAVVALALVVFAAGSVSTTGAQAHTGTHDNLDAGWLQKCGESGSGRFDPIVFPGQQQAGHNHTFTGGDPSPDATFKSLRAGGTTCPALISAGENKSLYWTESVYINGTRVTLQQVNVYYKRGNIRNNVHDIQPFPSGHKMITREGNGNSLAQWFCAGDSEGANGDFRSAPYRCKTDGPYDFVSLRLGFPQCGDGRLDSSDHMSHMRFPVDGSCPSTHPVEHPRIMTTFKFRTLRGDLIRKGDGTSPGVGEHADAFSAWDSAAVQELVTRCIHQNRNCSDGPL